MNNADKFKQIFDLYATELWAMSEKDFLAWLNAESDASDTNSNGMEKLKPCPFCGGEAKVKGNIMFGGYSVICLKCGAHVFFHGAETSRSANERRWNRRAKDARFDK